ncbi:hypothetical protein GOBAR_AA11750 [Gossypium barbadense]|uniref:Uncharacterized protein n=1 Tax=Gossypium barbadense TaxID=3634 RepID=A0A2P5XZX9_GOSBA|nr:hypothetical protein GOBAR_AA11750 [Gossypium barbadense]
MGNSLAGKKTTKVMKINGETLKLKTPVRAEDVVKDYPGHVLLESEAVKHFGVRAKPLEAHHKLEPKRLYFLVVLPEGPKERVPRRVRSGVNMSAKDRLESLMLSRRSVSDLTLMKGESTGAEKGESRAMRVRLRVPKAEVERLMKDSENEEEVAEKIMQLCTANGGNNPREGVVKGKQQVSWEGSHGSTGEGFKAQTGEFRGSEGRRWEPNRSRNLVVGKSITGSNSGVGRATKKVRIKRTEAPLDTDDPTMDVNGQKVEVVRVNKIYYKSILKGTPPDATSKNRMEEEFNLQEGVVVTELVEGIPLITFFVHREKDGKDHHCQTPGQEDWF